MLICFFLLLVATFKNVSEFFCSLQQFMSLEMSEKGSYVYYMNYISSGTSGHLKIDKF